MDREKVEHWELAGREVNGELPLSWEIIIEQKKRKAKKAESLSYFQAFKLVTNRSTAVD